MSDIFISWCDTLFEGCMTISVSKNVIVYVRRRSYFFPFLNWKIREKLQFLPEGKNLPIWSSWTYSTCIIHFLLFFFNKRMMAYMGKHFLKGFDRPHKRWGCTKNFSNWILEPRFKIFDGFTKTYAILTVFCGFQHYLVPLGRKKLGCD